MLLETIEVTCWPGANQLPSNTGTFELVASIIDVGAIDNFRGGINRDDFDA